MGHASIPQDIRQFELNYICSSLLFCKIRTTDDLTKNFEHLLEQIKHNPQIFKPTYTPEECFEIVKKAIARYNDVNAYSINLKEEHLKFFEKKTKKTN